VPRTRNLSSANSLPAERKPSGLRTAGHKQPLPGVSTKQRDIPVPQGFSFRRTSVSSFLVSSSAPPGKERTQSPLPCRARCSRIVTLPSQRTPPDESRSRQNRASSALYLSHTPGLQHLNHLTDSSGTAWTTCGRKSPSRFSITRQDKCHVSQGCYAQRLADVHFGQEATLTNCEESIPGGRSFFPATNTEARGNEQSQGCPRTRSVIFRPCRISASSHLSLTGKPFRASHG